MIEIGDCDEMADRIGGGVLRPGDYVLMISDGQIIGGERVTDNTPPEMLLPAMQETRIQATMLFWQSSPQRDLR